MYPSGSAGPRSATELPSCFDYLRSIADLSACVPRLGSARSGGSVDAAARHQCPGDARALVGERQVYGGSGLVMGNLDDPKVHAHALERLEKWGRGESIHVKPKEKKKKKK